MDLPETPTLQDLRDHLEDLDVQSRGPGLRPTVRQAIKDAMAQDRKRIQELTWRDRLTEHNKAFGGVNYLNPWYKSPGCHAHEFFWCKAEPEVYRDLKIYKRPDIDHPEFFTWDVVKDDVCLSQLAGPNGARKAIDEFLAGPTASYGSERMWGVAQTYLGLQFTPVQEPT